MSKKDRRVVRAAIVKAAAKKIGCTLKELFMRAMSGVTQVVVNLNKIPDKVVAYARELLKPRFHARMAIKRRQRYYRAAPSMGRC